MTLHKALSENSKASVPAGFGAEASPAQRADIQPGDLLVSMGSYWLSGVDQVGVLLSGVEPKVAIDVGFRRERGGRFFDGERRLSAR